MIKITIIFNKNIERVLYRYNKLYDYVGAKYHFCIKKKLQEQNNKAQYKLFNTIFDCYYYY